MSDGNLDIPEEKKDREDYEIYETILTREDDRDRQ